MSMTDDELKATLLRLRLSTDYHLRIRVVNAINLQLKARLATLPFFVADVVDTIELPKNACLDRNYDEIMNAVEDIAKQKHKQYLHAIDREFPIITLIDK